MTSPAPLPKYALLEIERKMLVDATRLPSLAGLPASRIDDRYLDGGCLRLRRIEPEDRTEVQYKLCKKYGPISACEEPITNLYLTRAEYELLLPLPGRDLTKRRIRYDWNGHRFSIDEFHGPHRGLYLCEIEASSAADLDAITFPSFCVEDVTRTVYYSGASLAALNIPFNTSVLT